MKAQLLACCIILSAVFTISAQGNIPQPTHALSYIAEDALSLPSLALESFSYYNGNGDLYEEKWNNWDGANWNLAFRKYFTLNASGQPTLILERSWDAATSTLVDSYRATKGYNANGLQNFNKEERWNSTTGVWDTESFELINFGNNDLELEHTNQEYDNGVQTSGSRILNTYDAADRLSEVVNQKWDAGVWTNDSKISNTYDATDRLSEVIGQIWDAGAWKNSSKSNYSYPGADENNFQVLGRLWDETNSNWGPQNTRLTQTATPLSTSGLFDFFDGVNWVPNTKYTITYNNNGQTLIRSSENWDANSATWMPFSVTTHTYTNDGQELSYSEAAWDFSGSFLSLNFKLERSFNADQSLHEVKLYKRESGLLFLWIVSDFDYGNYPVSTYTPSPQTNLSISPNPTSDFMQVQLGGKGTSNLTLFDLHGKVVASTTTTSNSAQISLIGQPAGTYFLRVEQGGVMKVLPVVKK